MPSPSTWIHQSSYEFVLGTTINTVTATLIAVIIGSNLNIYIMSKLKKQS